MSAPAPQAAPDAAEIVCRAYFGARWWDQHVRDLPHIAHAYAANMRRALTVAGREATAEDVLVAYYSELPWSAFTEDWPEIAAKHVERVQRGLDEAARA